MPASGYTEIHSDSGTIFDDGGSTGNYSTRVNSSLTIYPASSDKYIRIYGDYFLEDYYKSKITFYDGDTNSNIHLQTIYDNGNICIKSNTGAITMRFTADTETPRQGFNFNFYACEDYAQNINIFNVTDSTAEIRWDKIDQVSNWIFVLDNNITFNLDTNYIKLDSLESCMNYTFKVILPCEHQIQSCFFGRIYSFETYFCGENLKEINKFNISDTTAEISWNENNHSTQWVFTLNNNRTFYLDTNYIKLDSLESCSLYSFRINLICDSQITTCYHFNDEGVFGTTSQKSNKPYNFNIIKDCSSIEIYWHGKDSNTVWQVINNYNNDTILVDSCYAVFDSLNSGSNYSFKICPFVVNNEECDCEFINTYTDCCCPIPQNINVSNISSNSAVISWDSDNDTNAWILQYVIDNIQFGINNDSIITIYADTNYIELNNLTPVRPYKVFIYPICDTMNTFCRREIDFFTLLSAEACVEFTNLRGSNFFPQYGTYSNPYMHYGLIDYNYLSPQSRHTIHYDTAQKDERTNNLLSTIPLGELASFRLGNWLPGAEAESCTFAYYVDTNNFDMFLLKYAIVLEDPNHNQAQQPRFTLEIMDTNYVLFDEECGYTDFYASGDLNWNTVEGSTVIWKDWTSIGIDLSSYHNQKIFVRFTTYDCDEGGHFGYAYFNLKCDNRYTNKEFCGENDTLIFEAPLGFDYLWYNINNPEDTLSTSRELSVLVNNNTYICKCSNKENSNCNFNLTFIAEKRYPFPQFDNIEDTCGYKVYFYNKSIISSNDSIGIGDEKCLDIKWIFHDGSISFEQNPVFTYDSSGVYPVILIAKINDGICVDTLYKNIHIDISGIKTIIFSGDTIICRGSEVKISVNEFDSYLWINNDTTKTIIVSPLETTKYFIQVSDNGCIRYDSITIYVEPYYYMDTLFGVICRGASYNQNDFNENKEGFYTRIYTAYNGCDSIRNLVLKVVDKIYDYSVINLESNIIEELPIKLSAYCEYCNNYYWSTGSKDSVIDAYKYGNYFVRMDHVCGKIYDSILIISPEVNIYVPNAFTPNEAQNNNFFPIFENNKTLIIQSFEIYNRWGENIYSSDKTPWNGMYNNNNCQPGVYIWRLLYTTKYTGKKVFEMKGEVNLLR